MNEVTLGVVTAKNKLLCDGVEHKVRVKFNSYPRKVACDMISQKMLFSWEEWEETDCWFVSIGGKCENFIIPYVADGVEVLAKLPKDKICELSDVNITVASELILGTKCEMDTMQLAGMFTTVGTVIGRSRVAILGRVYDTKDDLTGVDFVIATMYLYELYAIEEHIGRDDVMVTVTLNWEHGKSGNYRAVKSLHGDYKHTLPLKFVNGSHDVKIVPPETWTMEYTSSRLVRHAYDCVCRRAAEFTESEGVTVPNDDEGELWQEVYDKLPDGMPKTHRSALRLLLRLLEGG